MTDASLLVALAERLKGVAVLCVGDVMLDRFIYGDVERISPEAPIPVLRIGREAAMLGGAGNVVRNLVALAATPAFVAVVGDDQAGRDITRLVGDHAEVDPCMVVENGRQTTIKTRFFAGGQQLLRADADTSPMLSESTRTTLVNDALSMMAGAKVLVLSDYGKGVLAPETLAALIAKATAEGKHVVVDPKGSDYSRYRGATLATPNRKELAEATQMPVDSDDAIVAAARHVIESCGIGNILVTRSQDGMTLVTGDHQIHHLPAAAQEVFDVSGAGDTVIAAMAAALAAEASLLDAARLANIAAGIVVAKIGTAVAYTADLVAALRHDDIHSAEAKILTLETARDRMAQWRRKNYRIGFTNGCFDLLHPGHVSLLAQARSACDRLIVGLNSDASVQRLKGPTRPVQAEMARSTVLASLASVDAVVIFDEDTPLKVIDTLRPDVLVKGADYTVATVVGADIVQSYGGKVFLADLSAGFSTTATIAKMNGEKQPV